MSKLKHNLIGIAGPLGAGKDTIGQIIQYLDTYYNNGYKHPITEDDFNSYLRNKHDLKASYQIKKFAGKLKDIVSLLTGLSKDEIEDRVIKETKLGPDWVNDYEDVYHTKLLRETYSPRDLLQLIGTDLFRDQIHPNIWVNATFADYKPIKSPASMSNVLDYTDCFPNWILTDVRFPNEVKAIQDRGGIILKVNRPWVPGLDQLVWFQNGSAWDKGIVKGLHVSKSLIVRSATGEKITIANEYIKPSEPHSSELALDNFKDWSPLHIVNKGTIQDLIHHINILLFK